MHKARTLEQMREIITELAALPRTARAPFCNAPGDDYTCWYRRHHWEELRAAQRLNAAAAVSRPECEATAEPTQPLDDGPTGGAASAMEALQIASSKGDAASVDAVGEAASVA